MPVGMWWLLPRFSLDFLPSEPHPYLLQPRFVTINDRSRTIYSDVQSASANEWHCGNVSKETGRCMIHGKHPFSCDFEVLRSTHFNELGTPNRLTTAPYSRAWALKRVDGKRGALCEIGAPCDEGAAEAVRKLRRLKEWMEYWGLTHRVDAALGYLERSEWKRGKPVMVNVDGTLVPF